MNRKDLFLSRENAKRFSLGSVSETMSDKKLKAILGGYSGQCHMKCTNDGDDTAANFYTVKCPSSLTEAQELCEENIGYYTNISCAGPSSCSD